MIRFHGIDRMPTKSRAKSAPHSPGPDPCVACEVRDISVCESLTDVELARLEAIKTTLAFKSGDVLIREGEPADHLFNVKSGAVKIYKLLADGRCQITGFLFPGDFLGLAHRETYVFSAEALNDVEVCRFPRTRYEEVVRSCPGLERRLLAVASNELVAAQDQMLLLGRKSAKEKIVSFLLQLSHRAVQRGRPATPVELPMTRTEISDYLGLTTETVSRVMTQLKTTGAIRIIGQSRVELLRPGKLDELAEGASPA